MIANDRLPWFHCFPSKLLGALASMRPDEQLVYVVVLLRIYEVRGPMPDPVEATSRRIGINRTRTANALDALFRDGKLIRVEGGIHNPFAIDALAEGDARHERLAKAGSSGGKKKAENIKLKQRSTSSGALAKAYQEDLDLESKSVEANASTGGEPPLDVRTKLFREGLAALQRITGKGRNACASLVGKWLRNVDDDCVAVLRAIEDAESNRVADPVPWILKALAHRMRGGVNGNGHRTGNGAATLLARMRKERRYGVDEVVDDARALPAGDASRH